MTKYNDFDYLFSLFTISRYGPMRHILIFHTANLVAHLTNDIFSVEKDDKIEPTVSAKSANPDMKCTYGNETMDIGDSVVGQDECVTCSCNVPPMVSCSRALNC